MIQAVHKYLNSVELSSAEKKNTTLKHSYDNWAMKNARFDCTTENKPTTSQQ